MVTFPVLKEFGKVVETAEQGDGSLPLTPWQRLNSPDGRPQQPSLTQPYPKPGLVRIPAVDLSWGRGGLTSAVDAPSRAEAPALPGRARHAAAARASCPPQFGVVQAVVFPTGTTTTRASPATAGPCPAYVPHRPILGHPVVAFQRVRAGGWWSSTAASRGCKPAKARPR